LDEVITAFKKDWQNRNRQTTDILITLLEDCLTYRLAKEFGEDDSEEVLRQKLQEEYARQIQSKEQKAHKLIRALFKHNIFNYELPADSLIHQELFSKKTWHFLGLTRQQMLMLGAVGGAAAGVTIDLATLGSSFGLFGSIGGILGAAGALFGTKSFPASTRLLGLELGRQELQIGPNESIQFLFILLDRAFLYYSHIINWAHGRRDYTLSDGANKQRMERSESQTRHWPAESLKICRNFSSAVRENDAARKEKAVQKLKPLLMKTFMTISNSE